MDPTCKTEENRAPGNGKTASARKVIQSLVKAAKALRIYLPNNPLYTEFLYRYEETLGEHLDEYGDLLIDISKFTLSCTGEKIYEEENARDSLAFRLHSDGLRSITFADGMERKEMNDFLIIMARDPENHDEDIVTRIWESHLPHLTYQLAEESLEIFSKDLGAHRAEGREQEKAFQRLYQEEVPAEPVPALENVPAGIYTLTTEETGYLKRLLLHEEQRSPMTDVITILYAVLLTEKDTELFEELITTMIKTIRDLLISGEIRYAVRMVKLLTSIQQDPKVPPQHRERTAQATGEILSPEIREGFGEMIRESDRSMRESIKELIISLGEHAIEPFCLILGSAEEKETRRAIIDGLAEVGSGNPERFFPYLSAPQWHLVRNAIHILRLIGSPHALEDVGRLASHKEQRVRREVLYFLETMPEDSSLKYLLAYLKDADYLLRINAVKALSRSKYKTALIPLQKLSGTADFETRNINERVAVYEAMGRIGAEEMIPVFRKMLLKNYRWNKTKGMESIQCAIAGLKGAETRTAVKVLEEAKAARKGDMQDLISEAIREFATPHTKSVPR